MSADPQPKSKGMPTGLIVVLVIAAVIGVLFLACVGAGVWFASSEQGQAMLEATQNWQNAPGTAELREIGCTTAMVMNFGDMTGVMGGLLPDEAESELPAETNFVICQTGGDAPSCAAVAAQYVAAAAPTENFMVQVQSSGGESCQDQFDTSGNRIGPS